MYVHIFYIETFIFVFDQNNENSQDQVCVRELIFSPNLSIQKILLDLKNIIYVYFFYIEILNILRSQNNENVQN